MRKQGRGSGCMAVLSAWLVLTAVASADQPGEGVLSHVRMPGVPIPANGAILIESLGSDELIIEVLDSSGAMITGASQSVGGLANGGTIYAWVPDQPFVPGTYAVTTIHPRDSSLAQLEEVQVIEAFDDAPPEIMSAPSASGLSGDYQTLCCQTPFADLFKHCSVIRQTSVVQVDGGLSSSAPAAKLNQFLFRYAPRTGVGTATVRPTTLEALAPIAFVNDADEYCFELIALNVATLEEHVYEGLPSCAERGDLYIGTTDVEPDPAFFEPQTCPFPPPPLEARWCEENQDACEAGATEDCEQYEYVCHDGPLPERWSTPDAGTRPPIEFTPPAEFLDAPAAAAAMHDSGCSAVARGHGAPRSSFAWLALAIAALLARSKRVAGL